MDYCIEVIKFSEEYISVRLLLLDLQKSRENSKESVTIVLFNKIYN